MDVQGPMVVNLDVLYELRHFVIDLGFVLPPIVPILPPGDEALDVSEGSTVLPASTVEFIREDGLIKLGTEESELLIGYRNAKRWHGGKI
jgi:hypothetical protein